MGGGGRGEGGGGRGGGGRGGGGRGEGGRGEGGGGRGEGGGGRGEGGGGRGEGGRGEGGEGGGGRGGGGRGEGGRGEGVYITYMYMDTRTVLTQGAGPRDQLSASSCNINGSSRYSSYWYMYMYIHVPLGDFIVSTLLMAFQCIFSLPVSRRIPRMSWAGWWVVGGGVGGWGGGGLVSRPYTSIYHKHCCL